MGFVAAWRSVSLTADNLKSINTSHELILGFI
jgi:hypothetical protein